MNRFPARSAEIAIYNHALTAAQVQAHFQSAGQSQHPQPGGSTLPSSVDGDRDGIPDILEQQLAEKFAPVLLFHPGEPNYPTNVNELLRQTSLDYHEQCAFGSRSIHSNEDQRVVSSPLHQSDLLGHAREVPACSGNPAFARLVSDSNDPESPKYGGPQPNQMFYLTNSAHEDGSLQDWNWVTYFHAYPTSDGGIMLQYWHLFAYNHFERGPPSIFPFDRHGGDWDAEIQVQLDASLSVRAVWFSRHQHDAPGDVFYAFRYDRGPTQQTLCTSTTTRTQL